MKFYLFLFTLLCLLQRNCMGVVPSLFNVQLVCNEIPTNQQVKAYRFYELIGTNRVFLFSSPTNGFTVTNVNILVPHTYTVTASNVFGESDFSVPLTIPVNPSPPNGLDVKQTSLVVPTSPTITIAGSIDLASWQEKIKIETLTNNSLKLTFTVLPEKKVQFWKQWTGPTPPAIP